MTGVRYTPLTDFSNDRLPPIPWKRTTMESVIGFSRSDILDLRRLERYVTIVVFALLSRSSCHREGVKSGKRIPVGAPTNVGAVAIAVSGCIESPGSHKRRGRQDSSRRAFFMLSAPFHAASLRRPFCATARSQAQDRQSPSSEDRRKNARKGRSWQTRRRISNSGSSNAAAVPLSLSCLLV